MPWVFVPTLAYHGDCNHRNFIEIYRTSRPIFLIKLKINHIRMTDLLPRGSQAPARGDRTATED